MSEHPQNPNDPQQQPPQGGSQAQGSHDHGHAHSHDHPDDQDNDHSHGHPSEAAGSGEGEGDAGTRALADALRRSFSVLKVIMGGLVLLFLFSNVKIVGPEERGVILRFGKPVGEGVNILLPPGPKLAWPFPIDEFQTIPISRIQQVSSTVGWHRTTAVGAALGDDEGNGVLDPMRDGYLMTGDANIVHVRAVFNYRISDATRYLFAFTNTPTLLTNALNNAITYVAAHSSVDALLRSGLAAFNEQVRSRVTRLVDEQGLGVLVENVNADIIPPRRVKPYFDQALEAKELVNKETLDAENRAIGVRQSAENMALKIVFASRNEVTNELVQIRNETNRFHALLPNFERAPNLSRHRFISELMQRIGPAIDYKIVLRDRADGSKQQIRPLINREETLETPKSSSEPAAAGDPH